MFAAVIVRNPAQTRRLVARASYVFLLVGILSGIFVVTSIMMMHSEGRLNPDFSSFLNSISNTLKFVVGLRRDYRPMTQEGNTYLWAAVFLFPMVFGWLTSDVVKAFLRKISAQLEQMIANWQPGDAFRWIFRLPLILAGMIPWKKPRDAAAG
jgi:integral membrane sensor domain MASE1